MPYPEWVEKQRKPGTNINCIRGKYYLYEVRSEWNPEKKRAQKKTGKYLGRITEEGLIPPRKKEEDKKGKIVVKEYGASSTLVNLGQNIYEKLKEYFSTDADLIFSLAVLRVIEKCPFKRAAFLYEQSYLSERFPGLTMSQSKLTCFLQRFGISREQRVGFMQEYLTNSKYMLFDGTKIISDSKRMEINRLGYNSHRQYDPQIYLIYAFSADEHKPEYYRILPETYGM